MDELSSEAQEVSAMLTGLTVRGVRRHRPTELVIEFADGTRLLVDAHGPLELSITGGPSE